MASYANNCSILASGRDLFSKVSGYLDDLPHFFTARQLRVQPTKFSAALFTNWTIEYSLKLDVKVDGIIQAVYRQESITTFKDFLPVNSVLVVKSPSKVDEELGCQRSNRKYAKLLPATLLSLGGFYGKIFYLLVNNTSLFL